MKKIGWIRIGLILTLLIGAVGCNTLGQRQSHHASSLYKYLYSNQASHIDSPSIPTLSLPLRIGIAFVPHDPDTRGDYGYRDDSAFSENEKMQLLKEVSDQFKSYPFVKSIEVIPTPYLAAKGGFANLDQLQQLYGVDVIALVSYDQVQFTDEGFLSLTYWTIVGAYVVQGERNETRTMLDAAVYDIASRKLLFRAPGISNVKGSATPINQSEELRHDSEKGFTDASTNLVANLQEQLDQFRERVKNAPSEYKIVHSPGYKGAGSFGVVETFVLSALGAFSIWMQKKNRR